MSDAGSTRRKPGHGRRRHRRAHIGAPPGTLQSHPDAPPPRVTALGFGPDDFLDVEVQDLDEIEDIRKRFPVTWVDVSGVGDAEAVRKIGELFGLHTLALEDVVNVPQRPKLEEYGDELFLITRMPRGGGGADTEQVSLFLGAGFLVTFQEEPGDCLNPVRSRIREGRPRIRAGAPDYLAYAVLDAIVDSYFPVLDELGNELEQLEEEILRDSGPTIVGTLHELKRRLTSVRRVVLPIRESLAGLVRDESPLVTDTTRLYLRDCLDHSFQLIELVESYRDLASGLLDLHLTIVSNRMNDIMKVLTIIATIFIPLGFIAGLYGMNFDAGASRWNMPELSWPFGYVFALGLMAAVAGGMIAFFRRKGWF